MRRARGRRCVLATLILVALIVLLGSCQLFAGSTIESWDHTVLESEFSAVDDTDYWEYRYEDSRFNSTDMFDMYEISDEGLSHWDAYFDDQRGVFFSQPVYGEGVVKWFAHPTAPDVVTDRTLRFYRIPVE
ncbi:MAG: hypothetical protein ACOCYG_09400 [Spirochaetota bacterium]